MKTTDSIKNRYATLFIALLMMAVSCNDDLGNYNYVEVNDVMVSIEKAYWVDKIDTLVTITPTISQTMAKNKDNLRYMWTLNSLSDMQDGDTISTDEVLKYQVKGSGNNYVYTYNGRLYVTDILTKAVQMIPFKFYIKKPYLGAWMVLHEKDKQTQLGSIEFLESGSADVSEDAYFKRTKTHLTGKPVMLGKIKNKPNVGYWGYEATNSFYCVTTNPEESGIFMQSEDLKLLRPFSKLIYQPDYTEFFDVTKTRAIGGSTEGGAMVSNGRVFAGSTRSPRMYKAEPASTITDGEPNVTKGSVVGNYHLFFDQKHHRFLSLYTGYTSYVGFNFNPTKDPKGVLYKMPNNVNIPAVDLDNIGEDKEVVYLGQGYWYGKTMMAGWARIEGYAVALSDAENKAYVYEFHPFALQGKRADDPEVLTGYYAVTKPMDMTKDTPFASSIAFSKIIFFAAGNKVYRWDYSASRNSVQVVWSHPDPAAKATVMKMAFDGDSDKQDPYTNYLHKPSRSLGVVFDLSADKSEMVILNLNTGGLLDSSEKVPAVRQFGEFGKIKDIEFI